MKSKHKLLLIVYFIVAVTILFFWFRSRKGFSERCVESYEMIKTFDYIGIIRSKYIDNHNHGARTLEIDSNGKVITWPIHEDQSGCYYYLETNDSIVKESGSYEIKVYRNSVFDRTFTIDYDCFGD